MPPAFVMDILRKDPDAKLVPNYETDHEDYEASQWPVFLPALYALWKNHPDPTQSVPCDLRVTQSGEGRFVYCCPNGPIRLSSAK